MFPSSLQRNELGYWLSRYQLSQSIFFFIRTNQNIITNKCPVKHQEDLHFKTECNLCFWYCWNQENRKPKGSSVDMIKLILLRKTNSDLSRFYVWDETIVESSVRNNLQQLLWRYQTSRAHTCTCYWIIYCILLLLIQNGSCGTMTFFH